MKKRAYGFAAVTILVWATLATVSKVLLHSLNVMLVLAVTSDIAAVALLVYCLAGNKLSQFRQCSGKDIFSMCLLGFIGFFLYNLFYLIGIEKLPSQQAMVLNYLWPALIIVFSAILFHEKMSWKKLTAVALSLGGVTIVAMNGNPGRLPGGNLQGILSCLFAAACYALYATWNKKQTYPKEIAMLAAFGVTGACATSCALVSGSFRELGGMTGTMWLGLLYSGLFVNAVGYTSWMLALEYGNTSVIANLAYLVPFASMVVAKVAIKEDISIYSVTGLLLIIGGIVIQFLAGTASHEADHQEKLHTEEVVR